MRTLERLRPEHGPADGDGPALRIADVVAGYANQAVLHGVDVHVDAGEVVTLLGANGAGKSTLLKTVMGTVPLMSGQILLHGRAIGGWSPHRRVKAGIGYSPEGRRIFANLTVEENLVVGATWRPGGRRADGIAQAVELFPILGERRGQRAGTLSGGEQQMLAVARAMMNNPTLLLVEEPSQGLAPVVVDRIYETLVRIAREQRIAVLVAEQFQQVREDASDRILVIDKGTVVADDELGMGELDTGELDTGEFGTGEFGTGGPGEGGWGAGT